MLSIAERSAMRLDGDLVDLAHSARHVDRVDSPADRLRSLRLPLTSAHIVSGLAAAWVHGAAPLPDVIDVATLRHRRAEVPAGCRALIRRVALHTCLDVDGVRVTSPLRTAVDLLADDRDDDVTRTAIRLLADDPRELRWAIPGSGRSRIERSLARLEGLDLVSRR
ncbi:hypothetical protein [Agrococcus jejuensis]|uniref:AbiEi antitoxin C-terminal domain-containing protein n=1 Tax=Agrococcus jejuensis TaxID=399736 RepID=A0A1G7ZRV9_9MICO|nr:hypothetical protein [Agrococcus jejuensis]SDH11431.1 hypothetical protein SAMN04489720_0084 [Agrococcus jejuensis]